MNKDNQDQGAYDNFYLKIIFNKLLLSIGRFGKSETSFLNFTISSFLNLKIA